MVNMSAARAAIETLYRGTCTVTEHQPYTKENKSTGYHDVNVHENKPCHLSFSQIKSTAQGDGAAATIQITKLFIAPEVQIKPGSKLTIAQNDITTEYKNSGVPAVFPTHQEIVLELFKGWA